MGKHSLGIPTNSQSGSISPSYCYLSHGHLLAPGRLRGPLLDVLDEAGVDPHLEVRGAGGQQHVVGVPVEAGDGGLEGLLDVLGHPPVHAGLVVADGDDLGSGAHGELVLVRGPANTGGRSEKRKRWEMLEE